MYPLLYRRKTRRRWLIGLLLLALSIRIVCEPKVRDVIREKTEAVLRSDAAFLAVLFLETGLRPSRTEGPAAAPPAQTGGAGAHAAEPVTSAQSAQQTLPPAAETQPGTETQPDTEAETQPDTEADTQPGTEAETTREPEAPSQPIPFTAAEAEAIAFRGNCDYETDKTALLLRPLGWTREPGPRVLIVHSHACEAYAQSEGFTYIPDANFRTLDPSRNVVAVGDALAAELEALGVEVLHDRSLNDYPDYNRSYAVARERILDWLAEYPSVTMVIDLHRDALDEPVRETVEWEGRTLAPLMLVVGTDEGGLSHPHWENNLSCGLKLQALGNRILPGLFKKLSFRRERFNGDLTPGSLIVEVGSTGNTLPEALASMPWLARCVAELLQCP